MFTDTDNATLVELCQLNDAELGYALERNSRLANRPDTDSSFKPHGWLAPDAADELASRFVMQCEIQTELYGRWAA